MLPEVAEQIEDGRLTDKAESSFPYSVYFKTVRSVITDYGEELMRRSPNEGCAILRNSIAAYLLRYRGLFAQPRQIIIGSGAEHLYGTVVRLLGQDKVYGIENPSYHQIRKVYEGTGAQCELLEMGEDGIRSAALAGMGADVLHVTPFHSYPSGVTASIRKRYEYLEWARADGRYIVEDDFDSEFFMPGKPIETLFMLDDSNSVIYINTFSKSLSPSIRMGYMILPENLLERYYETSGGFSCTVPVLEQYALAEFINKGYFEQHLSRMRRRHTG
jgi:GntR family transcriptional regulator/MocR family aminotransferase